MQKTHTFIEIVGTPASGDEISDLLSEQEVGIGKPVLTFKR